MVYITPDYIFEVSWEVCNKIGGIYTVLSTRAKTLQNLVDDKLIFIGPDVWTETECPFFIETKTPLKPWQQIAENEGLKVRVGRWDIPGQPIAVLVNFQPLFEKKDYLYTKIWEWYKVESDQAFGDYDESCIFSYGSALVIESLYRFINGQNKKVVAHFNEWTTGMGALYIQKNLPDIATVFTTHATSIGRSIAGNNRPLYDDLEHYNGDQMAWELNMRAKHSLEKQTAHHVDCFTTVSDITAKECKELLDKAVDVVTPNGFEHDFVPKTGHYKSKRDHARNTLSNIVEKLTGSRPKENAFFVATGGRYEFKNKGIDLFVDSLARLKEVDGFKREVCAFILVPAHMFAPRKELVDRLVGTDKSTEPLHDPYITHWLHYTEHDPIINQIKWLGLNNAPADKVKIFFVPIYLTGQDPIFHESYYDMLTGMDTSVFPSYYEPWGYTPLESIAFSIPTITTSLAGFGIWAKKQTGSSEIESGVAVINRSDSNQTEVSESICENLINLINLPDKKMNEIRDNALQLSKEADWAHFIRYYQEAYTIALQKTLRENQCM